MTLEAVRDDETDDDDGDSVMGRPKPYAEFLDEVNRQKIDSWKKARDDHLLNLRMAMVGVSPQICILMILWTI